MSDEYKHFPQMSLDTAGFLLEVRARGLFAMMLDKRGVEPTHQERNMMLGEEEITARAMGELAYKLGYGLHIGFQDRTYYDIVDDGDA